MSSDRASSAAGVVVQDHSGLCVAAASEPLPGVSSPELAEALALPRAVQLAGEQNFGRVFFRADCRWVVGRISSPLRDRSMVGSIIADIKMASRALSSVSFMHVRRHCNILAHVLAKSSFNSMSPGVFLSAPDCIRETLCNMFP